jgi:ribosomal protein S18 acetylase RimI-like enzyme
MIRQAQPEDSEAIALVHVRGWQAAYRDVFPEEVLAGLSVEQRAQMWRGQIASGGAVIVAEENGIVQGFAAVGPPQDEDSEDFGELYAIYVAPSRWGRGIGGELCGAAEEALRGRGFREAILWVLEDNPRACGFYEARGWHTDAARTVEILGVEVPELRYRKLL